MSKVLLVEPEYRSKFPPLGLLKIGSFHKTAGDKVVFVRGNSEQLRKATWDRIYVSSLFTWEMPRTVATLKYYAESVVSRNRLVVGGIGATLLSEYIKSHVSCKIVKGPLNKGGMISREIPALDNTMPDYSLIDNCGYDYQPHNSFFARSTQGCIRHCKFCAVSQLEPCFYYVRGWARNVELAAQSFGERRHLVLLDNNVLAAKSKLSTIVKTIRDLGFHRGALLDNRKRKVDFNQGIDARLITKESAAMLAEINLEPIRLAFDEDGMEIAYERAIALLADVSFKRFTNYVMYNFNDPPRSLYRRLEKNYELADKHGVAITGFPMRFAPIDSVDRGHISEQWCWKYLRGMRCILKATRGLVSTNQAFFHRAFGRDVGEFLRIIAMPDKYIVYRSEYELDGARDWRRRYSHLSGSSRREFLCILGRLGASSVKLVSKSEYQRFGALLCHYYKDKTLKIGG